LDIQYSQRTLQLATFHLLLLLVAVEDHHHHHHHHHHHRHHHRLLPDRHVEVGKKGAAAV
jgi:hypothetical protein